MKVYRKSLMDSYHAGGMDVDYPCRVRIDGDLIVVEYEDGHEISTYRGESRGDGHYRLRMDGGGGDATLHRFPDSPVLEGYWVEEGEQGMWRIRLSDDLN